MSRPRATTDPLMDLAISDPIDPVFGGGGVTATTQRIADEFTAASAVPGGLAHAPAVFISDLVSHAA